MTPWKLGPPESSRGAPWLWGGQGRGNKYIVPTWFYFGQALALGVERARVASPTEGLTGHSVTEVGRGKGRALHPGPVLQSRRLRSPKALPGPPTPERGAGLRSHPGREGLWPSGLAFFPLPGGELLLLESSH